MAENTLTAAPTREETIPKIVEDTAITTEYYGIVVYASGFSQGAEESTATTSAFNFDKTDHLKRTKDAITNNNPSPRQLNLSRIFELELLFDKGPRQ